MAATPGAVTLLSVTPKGQGSAEVKWGKDPVATNYAISYGPGPGNYLYGLAGTGNTDSAVISALDPKARYCFAVTPINDCAAGPLSNEVCSGVGEVLGTVFKGGEVLGLSTTASGDSADSLPDSLLPDQKLVLDPSNLLNPVRVMNAPERVAIASLSIDLAVAEAKLEGGFGQTFNGLAAHIAGSAYPGEGSNTVIYAHNKLGIFANLKYARIGQEITVETANGKFSYRVSEVKEVSPDQIDIVAPTGEETLTLYTCSGTNDEKRLVVTAKPI